MDIDKNVMIALAIVAALLLVNVIAVILFFLYGHLKSGSLRDKIRDVIYYMDEWADEMDNASKRAQAIAAVSQLLGWRKILIPTALIGILIDMEVAAIRRMQKSCTADADLHKEDGDKL